MKVRAGGSAAEKVTGQGRASRTGFRDPPSGRENGELHDVECEKRRRRAFARPVHDGEFRAKPKFRTPDAPMTDRHFHERGSQGQRRTGRQHSGRQAPAIAGEPASPAAAGWRFAEIDSSSVRHANDIGPETLIRRVAGDLAQAVAGNERGIAPLCTQHRDCVTIMQHEPKRIYTLCAFLRIVTA